MTFLWGDPSGNLTTITVDNVERILHTPFRSTGCMTLPCAPTKFIPANHPSGPPPFPFATAAIGDIPDENSNVVAEVNDDAVGAKTVFLNDDSGYPLIKHDDALVWRQAGVQPPPQPIHNWIYRVPWEFADRCHDWSFTILGGPGNPWMVTGAGFDYRVGDLNLIWEKIFEINIRGACFGWDGTATVTHEDLRAEDIARNEFGMIGQNASFMGLAWDSTDQELTVYRGSKVSGKWDGGATEIHSTRWSISVYPVQGLRCECPTGYYYIGFDPVANNNGSLIIEEWATHCSHLNFTQMQIESGF